MISRPRNRKRCLASLVLVLGLGGWGPMAPFVMAQGGGGGWQGLGFGGFGDGFGGYGGAFGIGVYPGTIGVGPGGMGFGMPGWGALQAGAGFNPARFNFDHSAGYRQPGYGYPSYPPGYGYGYGYGNGLPPSGHSTGGFDPLSAYVEPVYPAGSAYPFAPMPAFPQEDAQRSAAYVAPGAGAVATTPPHGRYLGIDEEPVLDTNGRRGIKVGKVYPGTAAELSGLKAGDVIHSINGYRTEARGNLAWIIANAASNNVLKMNVLTASDVQEHSITATIR